MRILAIGLIVFGAAPSIPYAQSQSTRPTLATEEPHYRALKELLTARQLNRQGFIFSAAALRIALGKCAPLNPLAIF